MDISLSLIHIFYFIAEVDDCFITTFSPDLDAAVIEIHVVNIQTYTFRYTDAGSPVSYTHLLRNKFAILIENTEEI